MILQFFLLQVKNKLLLFFLVKIIKIKYLHMYIFFTSCKED